MANATFEILECRWVVKPNWTDIYIRTGPASDGTIGVAGWWHTTVEPKIPALDYIKEALVSSSYFGWDQGSPKQEVP